MFFQDNETLTDLHRMLLSVVGANGYKTAAVKNSGNFLSQNLNLSKTRYLNSQVDGNLITQVVSRMLMLSRACRLERGAWCVQCK